MRERSHAVRLKRRGRERRSATLPQYSGTAPGLVTTSALKDNLEDLIWRMETPIFLPNQRQSKSGYSLSVCLCVCPSVFLSAVFVSCLSTCLSVCLYVSLVVSRMSMLSESGL